MPQVKRAVVIGAGLTGLTAAHLLSRNQVDVTVYERDFRVGGHARSESMGGIPYEPHGAHIFHTGDAPMWRLATSLVDMLPYRHRVLTELAGEMFSWPLQYDELERLDGWGTIRAELAKVGRVDATNFETWCVSQMGATLYHLFIEGYTAKQWGRPGSELASSIGPKRVELRRDGVRDLFRDPFQGWPVGGYGALCEAMACPVAGDVEIVMGETVTVADLGAVAAPGVPVIVTAALDDFFNGSHGPLQWRGVGLVARWMPKVAGFAQQAMVINRPSPDVAYTRTIESKWVLGPDTKTEGTMVMYEYPGAEAKHYPVPDVAGTSAQTQHAYEVELRDYERNPLIAAGRLARYTYINMDEAMRSGCAAAHRAWRSYP